MKKFKKIYIEITNICNLNCSFCSKDKREKREMSLEEFDHVLKQIDNYTDYLYLHVKGEPLIHSKFEEILNICKKYNKQVNITTNGTLLDKKIDEIVNSKTVRQVNISIHSFMNKNIINILKNGDLLSENGIQVVYRYWVNNDLEKELTDFILNYYQVSLNGDNTKLKDNIYLNKDREFVWPNLDNEYISNKGKCYGLRTHLSILSDGTIIPCCLDSSGIIKLGNIFNDDFETIINSKRVNNIIKGFQNNKLCEELCQKCGFIRKFDC